MQSTSIFWRWRAAERWWFAILGRGMGSQPYRLCGWPVSRIENINGMLSKMGCKVSYSTHENGWLVFKFETEEDLNQVLSEGPYFIFQRPLLLKVMHAFFDFGNEELSKIPVWVKLRNFPLELWNPQALGKILSKIGPPPPPHSHRPLDNIQGIYLICPCSGGNWCFHGT